VGACQLDRQHLGGCVLLLPGQLVLLHLHHHLLLLPPQLLLLQRCCLSAPELLPVLLL